MGKRTTFDEAGRKLCHRCGEFKPLSDFYKNAGTKHGVGSYCKPCHSTYTTEWFRNHPERSELIQRYQGAYRRGATSGRQSPTRLYEPPAYFADWERWRDFFGPYWSQHRSHLKTTYGITPDGYIALW